MPRLLPRLVRRYGDVPRFLVRSRVGAVLLVVVAILMALTGLTSPPAVARSASAPRAAPAAPAAPMAARITQKVTLGETSIDGPALSTVAQEATIRTVLAWTGTDAQHHLNLTSSTDGAHFTNKLTLGETSPFRPAAAQTFGAAPNSDLGPFVILAWTGTDSAHTLNVLWNAYDAPGTMRKKLTLWGERSIGAPGLAVFPLSGQQQPRLVLSWTGTDPNHSLNILPLDFGTLTPGTKVVLPQFSSNAGPNLTVRTFATGEPDELALCWTTRTQHLNLATSTDGVHFNAVLGSSGLSERSATAPSATLHEGSDPGTGVSWIAWTGTDPVHHLNVQVTTSFPQWPDPASTKTVLGDTALGGPQVQPVGLLLISWTGTDPQHHLNVAQVTTS